MRKTSRTSPRLSVVGLFQGLAVEMLHGQQQLPDPEHTADFSQFVAFPDVGMIDLLGHLVLRLRLLEEAVILRFLPDQPLEGDGAAVLVVRGQVDRAASAIANPSDDREPPDTENILAHLQLTQEPKTRQRLPKTTKMRHSPSVFL